MFGTDLIQDRPRATGRRPGALVAMVLIVAGTPVRSPAAVTLPPSADASLYQSTGGTVANGAGEFVFLGRNSGGNTRRALMAFDIAAAVPAGATITAATLDLSISSTAGGPAPVTLHAITTAWTEGPSDPTGSEGSGAPTEPGDATWIHASYPSALWTTPGGDFEPAPFAALTIDQPGAYAIASTDPLVERIQSWLDAPSTNLGFVLLGDESAPGTAKRVAARIAADAAARPTLTIEFTIPTPPTASWAVLCAIGARRRRRT